jgi:hypothetical protein
MELALPFIALSGLYVISNQNNEKPEKKKTIKKMQPENFTNMGIRSNLGVKTDNYIPNTDIPPQNYPVTNNKQLADTIGLYPNPNASTDKYFDQNYYEKQENAGVKVGNMPQQIYSLTGNYLDSASFKHNNMVPFNGGKIKGYTYDMNIAETVLDNMAGTGSQVIKKIEQAPLFKPEANMNWAYGAPNQSDFYQSRVNPGSRNNNVKPFESENVGPGLNNGFSTSGSGGFNSGMEHRNKWLPKTVDELRVETNPKMEYSLDGHEGPLQSVVKDVGIIGEIDKKLPDTFFINSPNRWLTTTGGQKGETLRSDQPTGIIKRNSNGTQYVGPAGNNERHGVLSKNNYEPCRREPTQSIPTLGATSTKNGHSETHQNRQNNYVSSKTNRQTTNQTTRTYGNAFSGFVGSVLSPIIDIIRPSRKEEMVNNMRIYGDAGTTVQGEIIYPHDTPKTTTKETTIHTPRTYINNQRGLNTYVNNQLELPINNRNQSNTYHTGIAGGSSSKYGEPSLDAVYSQTSNNIKSQTISNRATVGNMSLFNNNMNICLSKPDVSEQDFYTGSATSLIKLPPSTNTYGHVVLPNKTSITESDAQYNQQRMDPSMLQAFYNNPYTHSLASAV